MKWQRVVFLLIVLAQVAGAVEYLAVSHDNWYQNPGLESLLAWHHKRGVPVRLIHKSGWTAVEIRDSIRAEYGRHSPPALNWVLLVGEYAEIPMYPMGGVGRTDFWYAELSTPLDNCPEIGVARLSPTSNTDLSNQTRKVLDYLKNPPADSAWTEDYVLLSDSGSGAGLMRSIYGMPQPWYRHDFDTLFGVSAESLRTRLDRGAGVLMFNGSSDVGEWVLNARQGWYWRSSDVAGLNNDGMTPVVFSMGCLTGDIYQGTCLAEAWLRKYPGGAVACYGATQACYTYPTRGMCSTAVRCLGDTWTISVPGVRDYCNPVFDPGGIMQNGAAYVAKYWPGSPYPDNIYMYLMLGDPAMEIWSGGRPVAPTVVYPPTVPLGETDLPVSVRVAGRPVSKALVCAWKEPEFYVTGRTDDSGSVMLSINAQTPGEFWVTVSSGHATSQPHTPILPFEGTCTAVSGGIAQVPSAAAFALQVSRISAARAVRFDYSCPVSARLEISDAVGRCTESWPVPAGRGSLVWNTSGDASRVYFCRLSTARAAIQEKLILTR